MIIMVNAQTWLNQTINERQKRSIQKLLIADISFQQDPFYQSAYRNVQHAYYLNQPLTGKLNLSDFIRLRELQIEGTRITKLNLSRCSNLKEIRVDNNRLTQITFPRQARNLEAIHVTNNNLSASDLSCFSNYSVLKSLYLGTNDVAQINRGIYNRWNGSLTPLRHLQYLEELDINSTDISLGLNDIPLNNLQFFLFGSYDRQGAGVNNLKTMLNVEEDLAKSEETTHNFRKLNLIGNWRIARQVYAQIQQRSN
jgi:Leucine-rich repeat (LRR) protein